MEFKLQTLRDGVLQLEALNENHAVQHAFGLLLSPGSNTAAVRLKVNDTVTVVPFATPYAFALDKWYVLRLYVGGTPSNPFRVYVWERDNPAACPRAVMRVRAYYATVQSAWAGRTWRFRNLVNSQCNAQQGQCGAVAALSESL